MGLIDKVGHIGRYRFPRETARTTSKQLLKSLENFGLKPVHIRDRIPFWNITENDVVTLTAGDPKLQGRFGTVLHTLKPYNKLTLRERFFHQPNPSASAALMKQVQPEWFEQGTMPGLASSEMYSAIDTKSYRPIPFDINHVRLVVEIDNQLLTVQRVRRANLHFDRALKKPRWDRYGLVVKDGKKEWVHIPWPEKTPDFEPNDTRGSTALVASGLESKRQTYEPQITQSKREDPLLSIGRINFGHGHHSRYQRRQRLREQYYMSPEERELEKQATAAALREEREFLLLREKENVERSRVRDAEFREKQRQKA